MDVTGLQIEQTYIDIVSAIKSEVTIPVAVKLGPFFSNFANMAKRLDEGQLIEEPAQSPARALMGRLERDLIWNRDR